MLRSFDSTEKMHFERKILPGFVEASMDFDQNRSPETSQSNHFHQFMRGYCFGSIFLRRRMAASMGCRWPLRRTVTDHERCRRERRGKMCIRDSTCIAKQGGTVGPRRQRSGSHGLTDSMLGERGRSRPVGQSRNQWLHIRAGQSGRIGVDNVPISRRRVGMAAIGERIGALCASCRYRSV